MSTGQAFFSTITSALGKNPGAAPPDIFTTSPTDEQKALLERIKSRTWQDRQPLLQKIQEVAEPLHIDFHPQKSVQEIGAAIAGLIYEKSPEWGTDKSVVRWDHPLLDQLELEARPELKDIPVYTTCLPESHDEQDKLTLRNQVEQSFIGITSADYLVAATATLVMRSHPGHARSTSLVPAIHIAVVEEAKILATLEELYALLKWDPVEQEKGLTNNLSFVSGPSKTGDIELIMVHGAHGPRELHLFVVADR